MYTRFFGFKENPFNLTPDPRYLYPSRYHEEALAHLRYGIQERKGFIAITGGIGTGKTTLCRALLQELEPGTRSALIFNAFLSEMELLQAIHQEFGIAGGARPAPGRKELVDTLNRFLLEGFGNGANAVLVIDEAQNLEPAVLEQIRMLSNLETEREKLIQIVLVGQPELNALLSRPELRQLDERITVRYHLHSLPPGDLAGYVTHRLAVAGDQGRVQFSAAALKEIYAFSRGNPRRINALCDRALLAAYTRRVYRVDRQMARQAAVELRPAAALTLRRRVGMLRPWVRRSAAALLIAGLMGGAWVAGNRFLPAKTPQRHKALVGTIPAGAKTLFLGPKQSLAGLWRLHRLESAGAGRHGGDATLVTYRVNAEFAHLLRHPFRLKISDPASAQDAPRRFLLIRGFSPEGPVALDDRGDQRTLTRGFLRTYWGREVSWVYPERQGKAHLRQGDQGPAVLRVQRILHGLGYLVEPNGRYDAATVREITRFQRDFGLTADGIVGPRTQALLYQMEG